MNEEFKVKHTSKDDSPAYSQSLPAPINLKELKTKKSDHKASMDEFKCPELIVDAGIQDRDRSATDARCEPVYLSKDSKFVPMHVILNGECQTLRRIRFPMQLGKRFQRLLQNFVSSVPGRSIPLLQPEACLFPSNFY